MSAHGHRSIDDARMRRLLGYALTLATIPALKVFNHHISGPLLLRRVEYTILVLAHDNHDPTTKQLARALRVSVPYLTVTLDRMQERGLLTRVRSEVDRRSQFITLTESGRTLMRQADVVAASMETELLDVYTPAERAMLFELLNKLGVPHRRAAELGKGSAAGRTAGPERR